MTDKFFALYWCLLLVFPIIPFTDCKKPYSGMTDERLSSLVILHTRKHNSPADSCQIYKNCGVYGKSTKFGTMIVYDIVNNRGYEWFRYGPHRDLCHNSKYSRFNFLHQDSSMETRLPQTILN